MKNFYRFNINAFRTFLLGENYSLRLVIEETLVQPHLALPPTSSEGIPTALSDELKISHQNHSPQRLLLG